MDAHSGPRPRKPTFLTFFCLFGFAPVLMACWGTSRVIEGTPVVGERKCASLAFSQYAVNLGEVPAVGTIPASFYFWNQCDRPLRITALQASCGCLAPKIIGGKEEFGPGEHGQFMVTVKTANESPGPKFYSVTVRYDDGGPREAQVHFRLVIPERKVTVSPAEVYFYQLSGREDSREILVEDHRGSRLQVLGAEISTKQAKVRIGPAEPGANGSWTTPIRLDVPAVVRPGREIALLSIKTNDPEYSVIKVPVLIQGAPPRIQQTAGEAEIPADDQSQSDRPSPQRDADSRTRQKPESVSPPQGLKPGSS